MSNQVYEYVNHSEYAPVRAEIDDIIADVQDILREDGITFQPQLVGSGRRKMVTRIVGGNKGFDFDYNFHLSVIPEGKKPKAIKNQFREAFRQVLSGTRFKDPEDSTSVLTVKCVDAEHSRIIHSFDVAIIADFEGLPQQYIFNDKKGHYSWQIRGGKIQTKDQEDEIKDFYHDQKEDGWGYVRDVYLQRKNANNNPDKHSFNLYVESINAVHDRMLKDPRHKKWKNKRR